MTFKWTDNQCDAPYLIFKIKLDLNLISVLTRAFYINMNMQRLFNSDLTHEITIIDSIQVAYATPIVNLEECVIKASFTVFLII